MKNTAQLRLYIAERGEVSLGRNALGVDVNCVKRKEELVFMKMIREWSSWWPSATSAAVTIPIASTGVERGGALSNKSCKRTLFFYLSGWCRFT